MLLDAHQKIGCGNWVGANMGHLITLGQNEENKTPKNSVKKRSER